MTRFKILATDQSYISTEIDAGHAEDIFSIVQRLDCKEADVLADGVYSFSVRIGHKDLWSIFQRDHVTGWESVRLFG